MIAAIGASSQWAALNEKSAPPLYAKLRVTPQFCVE